jgi:hypothetical protein
MITVELTEPAVIGGQIHAAGKTVTVPSQDAVDKGYHEYAKVFKRQQLKQLGLDDPTMLGKVSDAAQFAIFGLARQVMAQKLALEQATTAEEYFASMKQMYTDNAELVNFASMVLQGLESGTVKLTPLVKGEAATAQEVLASFTVSSSVFE